MSRFDRLCCLVALAGLLWAFAGFCEVVASSYREMVAIYAAQRARR
jgi:hypothetical protein